MPLRTLRALLPLRHAAGSCGCPLTATGAAARTPTPRAAATTHAARAEPPAGIRALATKSGAHASPATAGRGHRAPKGAGSRSARRAALCRSTQRGKTSSSWETACPSGTPRTSRRTWRGSRWCSTRPGAATGVRRRRATAGAAWSVSSPRRTAPRSGRTCSGGTSGSTTWTWAKAPCPGRAGARQSTPRTSTRLPPGWPC
mmetsp:Transcript_1444/g.3940  ORF Transcript_1444/g.3940 Transcript_1444/m.3940 type:complete len:201 (-) Transcript_1444:338-940(-)